MAKKSKKIDQAIDAALELAADRSWGDVRLNDIAAAAGMTLARMQALGASKTGILKAFARRIDHALLASLENDPVEGDVHDRLFDILMRRMEMLEAHKAAVRNIITAPADGPQELASLLSTAAANQAWVLAAAGIDDSGLREAVKRHGLAMISARVLKVWADDDDPGLARTMAELDRQLRDGAVWLSRMQAPIGLCTALGNLVRAVANRRTANRETGQAQEDS